MKMEEDCLLCSMATVTRGEERAWICLGVVFQLVKIINNFSLSVTKINYYNYYSLQFPSKNVRHSCILYLHV